VARMGDRRGAYRVLVGRREGYRQFGTPRRKWVNNIMTDLQEVDWGTRSGLNWLWLGTGGGLL
jgi:hypothetical protein